MSGAAAQRTPAFLGLGVLKTGTTLLHSWLDAHPQVCVPTDRKEVDFFSRYYDRGFGWYRGLFDPAPGQVVGEYSITYIESSRALERIARDLPTVRCIVSLRDPASRLDSQYRHWVMRTGYRGSRETFMREHPNAVESSRYAARLARLYDLFPASNVLVLLFEEVVAEPAASARRLFEFVGVDPAVGVDLVRRVNATRGVRSPRLARLHRFVRTQATARDVRWLLRLGRRLGVSRLTLTSRDERGIPPRIARDDAAVIRRRFSDDIAGTSAILGRDLTELWTD